MLLRFPLAYLFNELLLFSFVFSLSFSFCWSRARCRCALRLSIVSHPRFDKSDPVFDTLAWMGQPMVCRGYWTMSERPFSFVQSATNCLLPNEPSYVSPPKQTTHPKWKQSKLYRQLHCRSWHKTDASTPIPNTISFSKYHNNSLITT